MNQQISLQVNGEAKACPPGIALSEFLVTFGVNPHLVVVEYNGEILHRSHWDQILMAEGDRLEIVTIVGGG